MVSGEAPRREEATAAAAAAEPAAPSTATASDTHASHVLSGPATDFGFSGGLPDAAADPLVGTEVGGIHLERIIGEGGMGRVYEGRQDHPARTVAVKVMRLPANDTAAVRRFRREADALGRLRHPGIAQIFLAGVQRIGMVEVPYYAMELVPGARTLVHACRELPLRRRVEILLAACEAVGHGHAAGIVHRDLKPANVLVDASGQPKVIDFGIAKIDEAEADAGGPRTLTGQFVGTRPYMAPEQLLERREAIGPPTDVYALGVLMHEALAGRLPYDVTGKTLVETAQIVHGRSPRPLVVAEARAADRELCAGLQAIAEKCLAKAAPDRYATASGLADDLRLLLEGGQPAAATAARTGPASFFRGRWAAALAAVMLVLGLAGWWASMPRDGVRGRLRAGASVAAAPRLVGGGFATVSSGRTAPLGQVHLSFDEDVVDLSSADLKLSRDGQPVAVDGMTVEGGPRTWLVGGLKPLTMEAGEYLLAFVGTPESPVDAAGRVVTGTAQVRWRSPPYREFHISVLDDDWERHVVSMDHAERYTEQHAGKNTFIRPTEAGREGVVLLRFDVPFEIQDATVRVPLAVWTTGDPFPYDPGARAACDISSDGREWTTIVTREANRGGFEDAPHDIGRIVAGGRQIWVRGRLTATREWPGDGLIFAQFLRENPEERGAGFVLTATGPHPPVIPAADP
jgi:hypothetical protein